MIYELNACLHCGGKARIIEQGSTCEGLRRVEYYVRCMGCGIMTPTDESKQKMIDLWNSRAPEPEPKPLILEELREREGKPVWIRFCDGSGGEWGKVFLLPRSCLFVLISEDECMWGSLYGITWLAYDRPPKEAS